MMSLLQCRLTLVLLFVFAVSGISYAEWMTSDAPGAANIRGVKPRSISFKPGVHHTKNAHAKRIPRPGRFVEPERIFSLVPEQLQRDRSLPSLDPSPFSATALIKNINGITYNGSSPSDSTIAVGPQHVVVAVNTSLAVYLKGGAKLSQSNFEDFFANFDEVEGADFFDPKLTYDQYAGHFILIVDAYRESDGRSWYMVVASKTSDVRAGWTGWALDMGLNGAARTRFWADYPGLGLDSQAVYVTANMFNAAGIFQYAKLRVLRKSDLYSFQTLPWYDFWQLKDATGAKSFTVQPVHSIGTTGVEHMVSLNSFQGASLTLWTVSNAGATPQLTKKRVNVASFKTAYDFPAEQKGGGSYLDVGDSRLSDAVHRDGIIYVSHTIQKNWGSGMVSAIRMYQITPAGALQQSITFGADGAYYFYPAVTADPSGNMILVFSRSSPAEFASIRFTHEKSGDTDLQPSSLLKGGSSNYFWFPDNSGVERWGDYSGIANDSDGSVWIHSQYADTPAREWTTRVGRVKY